MKLKCEKFVAAYCGSPWGFCLQHVCADILHVIILNFVNSGHMVYGEQGPDVSTILTE